MIDGTSTTVGVQTHPADLLLLASAATEWRLAAALRAILTGEPEIG